MKLRIGLSCWRGGEGRVRRDGGKKEVCGEKWIKSPLNVNVVQRSTHSPVQCTLRGDHSH